MKTSLAKQIQESVSKLELEHENAIVEIYLLISRLEECVGYLNRWEPGDRPGGVPQAIKGSEDRIQRAKERFPEVP